MIPESAGAKPGVIEAPEEWAQRALRRQARRASRPTAWHVQRIMIGMLLAMTATLAWLGVLSGERRVDMELQVQPGRPGLSLRAAANPILEPFIGTQLLAMRPMFEGEADPPVPTAHPPQQPWVAVSPAGQRHPLRWVVRDAAREQSALAQIQIAHALSAPRVAMWFDGAPAPVVVATERRGLLGLGVWPWVVSGLAMALATLAMAMVLTRRRAYVTYAWLALPMVVALMMLAFATLPGLGSLQSWSMPVARIESLCEMTFAALLATTVLRYAGGPVTPRAWLVPVWALCGTVTLLFALGRLEGAWFWHDGVLLSFEVMAVARLWSVRRPGSTPQGGMQAVMLMVVMVTLLFAAITNLVGGWAGAFGVANELVGRGAWLILSSVMHAILPFALLSRPMLRDTMLLSALVALAVSVAMLLVAAGLAEPLDASVVGLAAAALISVPASRWVVQRIGASNLSPEELFGQIYHGVRSVERDPSKAPEEMRLLLQTMFSPLESVVVERPMTRVWGSEDGTVMVVPLTLQTPDEARQQAAPEQASVLVMRYPRNGTRLFTPADRAVALRLADQVRRAIAQERAVEQGRHEERKRIAQDLHDDIGARLLTLMYLAPDEATETYVRDTLQDLKTLTRGLAASQHPIGAAIGEWKADIAHRLESAQVHLNWVFATDDETRMLTVVQWSALTRILRELVSNVVAHSGARTVWVHAQHEGDALTLRFENDGQVVDPKTWAPGLGLGGITKRVRGLGGTVEWTARAGGGTRVDIAVRLQRPVH